MAAIYFVFMMAGAFGYRAAAGRLAAGGLDAAGRRRKAMITQRQVHLRDAHKTPQFWLIWAVLCLNVTRRHRRHRHGLADAAGDFRRLADRPARRRVHRARCRAEAAVAAIAAGFTGLLSLFNIGGRFFWASLSD